MIAKRSTSLGKSRLVDLFTGEEKLTVNACSLVGMLSCAAKILWNRYSTVISGFITAKILTFIQKVHVRHYLDWLAQDVLKEIFMQA